MRSIERLFNNIQDDFPRWSSYLCFAETVRGKKFGRHSLVRNFFRLVDREDYASREKRQIIDYLMSLTKESAVPDLRECKYL